jgi:ABC-type Zn uptake system ZnuABC Zn-binding protein ZnuA
MQLRLSPDQLEAKTALESAVEEVKQELVAESDDQKKDALKVELKEREAKLDTLLAEFEVTLAGLPIYIHRAISLTSDHMPSSEPPFVPVAL